MYIKAISTNKILAFSLIEVMISALILSISLLGAASLQSKGLFSVIEAGRQEAATQMINQLTTFALTADAANPDAPNNFIKMVDKTAPSANCYTPSGCSEADFYKTTVLEWKSLLANLLPNGKGCACLVQTAGFTTSASAQPATIRVAVNWKNISNRISTISIDTQVSSAIVASLSNLSTCAAPVPPQFNISNYPTQICDSNV